MPQLSIFMGALLCAGVIVGVLIDNVGSARADQKRALRICADPNNLPFSNDRMEGFENRIVELVADDLEASVEYVWWAQRRGFLRNTLYAGKCDIVPGIPSSHEMVLATRPYYRSTYVFLSRRDSGLSLTSLDDPSLKDLRIGVHLIGDDGVNTPPVHALTRRGIVDGVVGYMIYGDYAEDSPPARLVEAVSAGKVDLAILWGPFAGYFGPKQSSVLDIRPVLPRIDLPALPFVFSMSMGVRRGDLGLKSELDAALRRSAEDIDAILIEYGVPQL